MSRKAYPKQFLKLFNEPSPFQQTVKRLNESGLGRFSVLGADEHRFICSDQLEELREAPDYLVLEPVARNTAAPAAVAALLAARESADELVLLVPADHEIDDAGAFGRAVFASCEAAQQGAIVTFGIVASEPATGFGYIEVADTAAAQKSAAPIEVKSFREKPDLKTARKFVKGGRHFWNAGIFLFSARTMLEAFKTHAPDVLAACEQALSKAREDVGYLTLDAESLERAPSISVDDAIMEKFPRIMTMPLAVNWSDLGSWSAVWQSRRDRDGKGSSAGAQIGGGNVVGGDVLLLDSKDSLMISDGPLVTGIGLENMVVIASPDVVLVIPRERSQDVRVIVDALQRAGRDEAVAHTRMHRPWGWYERVSLGNRFQVKRIMVKPGAKLSLQSHLHRSEHWVVVSGTARVTVGEFIKTIGENESAYVPVGAVHRLENPGRIPVVMIEVQSGPYLGEDDIVRYEDIYARSLEQAPVA